MSILISGRKGPPLSPGDASVQVICDINVENAPQKVTFR